MTTLRPLLALVANDHEWFARSLESILEPRGFRVVRVRTGNEAVEAAIASLPDVVILDWRMPGMSGLEVCRRLRDDPRLGRTTPVVITTADRVGRNERLEAYAAGAWELCSAPVDGEVFLLKLDTFVQAKREVDLLRELTASARTIRP